MTRFDFEIKNVMKTTIIKFELNNSNILFIGLLLFYVINFEPAGFVIVSADNRSKPVLGYSFENLYDVNNIPPHYDYWLGYMQIRLNILLLRI